MESPLRCGNDPFRVGCRYGDAMKLIVLGATGGTGIEIVRQAIAHVIR